VYKHVKALSSRIPWWRGRLNTFFAEGVCNRDAESRGSADSPRRGVNVEAWLLLMRCDALLGAFVSQARRVLGGGSRIRIAQPQHQAFAE